MLSSCPLRLFYCDQYEFPLPAGRKYRLLREALSSDPRFLLQPSRLASRDDLLRVHRQIYVDGFLEGTLAREVMRRIGFPWSPELVSRTLASVGGTLSAAECALEHGVSGNLAGGTHHASRTEGAGFCVFNDMAVAIERLRARTALRRFAVVDLDVHQGDGTAAIYAGDPDVFTLSLHAESNFPLRKQTSRLDLALPDGLTDEPYLHQLARALQSICRFQPELVFYQSGVDALESDRLGKLALSRQGLRLRDELVFKTIRQRNIPLVITLGGGYSEPIELTVEAHAQTFRAAAEALAIHADQTKSC
jgi:acetoin utilization deacetylase AcuC-like enzyme